MSRLITRPRTPIAAQLLRPDKRPRGPNALKLSDPYTRNLIFSSTLLDNRNLATSLKGSIQGQAYFNKDIGIVCDATNQSDYLKFDSWTRNKLAFGNNDFLIVGKAIYGSGGSGANPTLVSNGDTGTDEWMLRYYRTAASLDFYGKGGSIRLTSSVLNLSDGEKFTFAVGRVGDLASLYFNGALSDTDTSAGGGLFSVSSLAGIGAADENVSRWWDGSIEFVHIWSGVTSDSHIDIIQELELRPYRFIRPASDAPFLFPEEVPPVTGDDNAIFMASNF